DCAAGLAAARCLQRRVPPALHLGRRRPRDRRGQRRRAGRAAPQRRPGAGGRAPLMGMLDAALRLVRPSGSAWRIRLVSAAVCIAGCTAAAGGAGRSYLPLAAVDPTPAPGGAPQILNVSAPTEGGARFERLEWAFDLSKSYANPYYSYDPARTRAAT